MKSIRTDEQLVDQFLTGQKEDSDIAFETLVKRHGPMVLGVCRSVLRRDQDAEDAFQATFLAWRARPAPSTIARSWGVGSTRSPTEPRSERGHVASDPPRGWRTRRWKNLNRGPSTLRAVTSFGCSSARRSMACPRSTARWCSTPTWKARATSRSPGCFNVRSAQSRGGCREPATCCEPGSSTRLGPGRGPLSMGMSRAPDAG